jgi:hypothetical protein
MAGKKITELTSGSLNNLSSTGVVPVAFSGLTYQYTISDIKSKILYSGSNYYLNPQYFTEIVTTGATFLGDSPNDFTRVIGTLQVTGSINVDGNMQTSDYLIVGSKENLNSSSNNYSSLHVRTTGSINVANFKGNNQYYTQLTLQNQSSSSLASTDIVVLADNGSENNHFVDLGINSSTYNGGFVGRENDAYLLNVGHDLYIGTIGGVTSKLKLFAQNSWETPQITIDNGKVFFNTGSYNTNSTYNFNGSIYNNNNIISTGNVSASAFYGNGQYLINLPKPTFDDIDILGFANTGSNTFTDNQIISGSVTVTGNVNISGSVNVENTTLLTSTTILSIETITSSSYAEITPVSGTLYIIID